MRQNHGKDAWGTRANALWGTTGGRRTRLALIASAIAVFASIAGVVSPSGSSSSDKKAVVEPGLVEKAQASADGTVRVIVQSVADSAKAEKALEKAKSSGQGSGKGRGLLRRLASASAVAAEVTAAELEKLAADSDVLAITQDAPIGATNFSNSQLWVPAVEFLSPSTNAWTAGSSYNFPTIAIVDSGVEPRADFGSRLAASVNFVSSGVNSAGDGFGHGTLVAGIAAGGAAGYSGVSPKSKIVSLDVLNDAGAGFMSDAIAAADWILANRAQYNIRVANFSIGAGGGATVLYDPLDRAVEKLWLNGVVVVAAAGNYAVNGAQSGVLYSPANDPFVITVGASDVNGTGKNSNDFAAPWSSWGYTYDGFFKPELAAPGRQIISSVPATSTLATTFPTRKTGATYMWMSGTSFAAPVVSGVAAWFLAKYPNWTPDQVKGALMLDADVPSGYSGNGALGVGVVDGDGDVGTSSPPNPNAALYQFVTTEAGTGLKVFNSASWANAAAANASWASASWSSASWSSASWSSASWSSASWSSASWSSASWSSASWASASWSSASWANASWSSASWANFAGVQ